MKEILESEDFKRKLIKAIEYGIWEDYDDEGRVFDRFESEDSYSKIIDLLKETFKEKL